MKKTYAFLATLLLASGVAAQNPTAYFMEGTTFRSQFNPAFAPLRGYVNIPGLGGIDINASGNLAVDKLLYPRNGKLVPLLDEAVSTRQALSGLNADNLLGIDTRVNLIGFGAFTRTTRISGRSTSTPARPPTLRCPTRSSHSSRKARAATSTTSASRPTATSKRPSATRSRCSTTGFTSVSAANSSSEPPAPACTSPDST